MPGQFAAGMDEPGLAAGLDELSRERLAEGRRMLADICAEADALHDAVQAETDRGQFGGPAMRASRDWDEAARIAGLAPEQLRCLLFAAAERFAQGEEYSVPARLFWHLSQRPPELAVGDVRLLAAVSEPGPAQACYQPFELAVERTEHLLATGAPGARALADTLADQVSTWNPMTYYGLVEAACQDPQRFSRLRDKALDMAGRPPAWPPTEGPVGRDDGFGLAVIGWLGLAEDWSPGVAGLLAHCVTAKSARPLTRWEKACRQHLDAVDGAGELIRGLLELLVTAPPVTFLTTSSGRHSVLLGHNEQLARGLIWAAGLLDPPWLPDVLRAVAVRCLRLCSGHVFRPTAVPGEKVPYACVRSLARSGSDASLTALARIGRSSANRRVQRELAKALEEVSARRGMSPASVADRLVPGYGLSAGGTLTIAAGAESWTVQLDDRHGAVLAGPSDTPAPGAVTEAVTDIRATVSLTRARLEAFFADAREWHVEDFLECYVRHPLSGWLANRLAWTFTPPGGEAITGFPDAGGDTVRTVHGEQPVPPGALVSLLHPVTVSKAQLSGLRQVAAELGLVQPIRQLWRETYRPRETEQSAGLFCERYSGHVLRFRQFYGLARRRGWGGGFLSGAWDGGDSAVARRDYPAAGLRASWAVSQPDCLSHEVAVDLCATGPLAFSPLDDAVRTPIPLADVPPHVFSEALRDLDLLVSVATVANDPVWLENVTSHEALRGYWERVARDGPGGLRAHRREVLAPFYAEQDARRFKLTDRDLIVHGSLASYRIDLATANVRMDPAGKWLSFDTRLSPEDLYRQHVLGLPAIDDDEILQRILIRAAILADDEHLASRKLLKQIRG